MSNIFSDPSDSLFAQQQSNFNGENLPWWQRNFLLRQPTLVNAWTGVFPTVLVNIFGIVIFLRLGWIVGTAGLQQAFLILILCTLFSGITVLSALGICERRQIKSGGIYNLVSMVLGKRIGGTVGIIYTFGQATAISLSALGFGESMTKLFEVFNPMTTKVFSIVVLIVLTVLNFAGLRFIIRLQMLLLCCLLLAILDFALGGFFFTHDPEHGIGSWSREQLSKNWNSNYQATNCTIGFQGEFEEGPTFHTNDESFFSVFAVLFANFIGVLAGVNMSANLIDPLKNIADGELSALAVSFLMCFCFMLMLGASVDRNALLCDYIIGKRISLTKLVFLAGLYISCLSSILSSTLGTSRVIGGIASEGLIPPLTNLIHEDMTGKELMKSTIFVTGFAVFFVVLGDLNELAVLSTIPFLVTYAFVNYSYVSLAMSDDFENINNEFKVNPQVSQYGSLYQDIGTGNKESNLQGLFQSEESSSIPGHLPKAGQSAVDDVWELKSKGWYYRYINRYVSLIAAIVDICVIIFINKWYALFHLVAFILLYIYLRSSPESEEGISKFSLIHMLRVALAKTDIDNSLFSQSANRPKVGEPSTNPFAAATMQMTQLNEESHDFSDRKKYHHTELVGPQ